MANSVTNKKFITKNGLLTQNVEYVSPDQSAKINLEMLDTATLSWEGSNAGQVFSITDSLDGVIFSVNDGAGLPSIEVVDDGTIRLAEFGGNVLIGTDVDNETDLLQIEGSVLATSFNTSSDATLKENITQIENGLDIVTSLRGVRYDWKSSSVSPTIGVIAQEVEQVLPEVVFQPNGKGLYKSVSYGNIVAVLIEAIKELKQEVDDLKKQ